MTVSGCNGSKGYDHCLKGVGGPHSPYKPSSAIEAWSEGDRVLVGSSIYTVLAKSVSGGAYLGYRRAGVSDVRLFVK